MNAMEIIKEAGLSHAELESPVLRQRLQESGELFIAPDNLRVSTICTLFRAVDKYTAHLPEEKREVINVSLWAALDTGEAHEDREAFVAEVAEVLEEVCPQGYYFGSKSVSGMEWLGFFQQ